MSLPRCLTILDPSSLFTSVCPAGKYTGLQDSYLSVIKSLQVCAEKKARMDSYLGIRLSQAAAAAVLGRGGLDFNPVDGFSRVCC